MIIGLRIDIDTYRGTRYGVPNLCRVLAEHSIRASFFFSVGPDNMGRHLWRLLRPAFLLKMLRTKATSLYGWDILLKGTFWPGPVIGEKLSSIIRSVSDAGHECGLHAWDHHAWQAHIDTMGHDAIHQSLRRGMEMLTKILGYTPYCSAVPGWKCNDLVLMEKEKFPFHYNSDCRGDGIFYPVVKKRELSVPQIPDTLPTYDEVVGHRGISNKNYNDYMLSIVRPDRLTGLTSHAEVEGLSCFSMFGRFLAMAREKGISFVPLGTLLPEFQKTSQAILAPKEIQGREGWVSFQEKVGDVA